MLHDIRWIYNMLPICATGTKTTALTCAKAVQVPASHQEMKPGMAPVGGELQWGSTSCRWSHNGLVLLWGLCALGLSSLGSHVKSCGGPLCHAVLIMVAQPMRANTSEARASGQKRWGNSRKILNSLNAQVLRFEDSMIVLKQCSESHGMDKSASYSNLKRGL